MPQPLTTVRPGPYTLDFSPGAEKKAPQVALLALHAINAASQADACFALLIPSFTYGRSKPVIEYYLSLRNDGPKFAVIEALAAASLSEARFALFKAIAKFYDRALKGRQPLAHWMWGYCTEIPDALVLLDPRDWLEQEGLIEPLNLKIAMSHLKGDKKAAEECEQEIENIQASRLHKFIVYRETDMTIIGKDLWLAYQRIEDFHQLLAWDLVDKQEADKRALALAQTPEIASLLAAQPKPQPDLLKDTVQPTAQKPDAGSSQ